MRAYRSVSTLRLIGPIGILTLTAAAAATRQDAVTVTTLQTTGDSLFTASRLGGVAVGPDGAIYVSSFRAEVWRIAADRRVTLLTQQLRGTSGNTLDREGRLLQGSFVTNSVHRLNPDGTMETYAEGLNGPVGMVMDTAGSLYVCNCRNNTVARVAPDRTVTVHARSQYVDCPNGITLGPDGTAYVVSYNNGHVVGVSRDGSTSLVQTLPDGGNAHIVFTEGAFYITRIAQNQLVRMTPDGAYELVAGTGGVGPADGPGLEAELAHPNGIAVGPNGKLYLNTIVGPWKTGAPGALTIREITPRR